MQWTQGGVALKGASFPYFLTGASHKRGREKKVWDSPVIPVLWLRRGGPKKTESDAILVSSGLSVLAFFAETWYSVPFGLGLFRDGLG